MGFEECAFPFLAPATSPSTLSKAMEFGAPSDHCVRLQRHCSDESGFTKKKLARLIEIKASRDGQWQITPKNLVWSISKANNRGLYRLISPCATRTNWMLTPRISLSPMALKPSPKGQICRPPSKRLNCSSRQAYCFAPGKAANAGSVATSGRNGAKRCAPGLESRES